MPELKIDSHEHIAVFIMSKPYHHGCWQKRGSQPRKHHSLTNIKKGYPKSHRGKFEKTLKQLQKDGLINIFPHTGNGEPHVCAILEHDTLNKGIAIANKWRTAEGLPPWSNEFKELIK